MVNNCIIINLDNRTDLWNNLTSFREEWIKLGKICNRISGISYKNKSNVINAFVLDNKINLNGSGFRKSKNAFLGELGCYMSHVESWKYIINNNLDNCLILEDGIEFIRNDLQNLSIDENDDIIFINEEMIKQNNNFIGYGTQGYILTNTGAHKLIKHCEILSMPIDLQIRELCNQNNINANIMDYPFVKRKMNRESSIDEIILKQNDNINLNDKQDISSIIYRIITNLLKKNINLDDFLE